MVSLHDNELLVSDNADGGILALHITKIIKAEFALQAFERSQ
jgi:hypothetical protein